MKFKLGDCFIDRYNTVYMLGFEDNKYILINLETGTIFYKRIDVRDVTDIQWNDLADLIIPYNFKFIWRKDAFEILENKEMK